LYLSKLNASPDKTDLGDAKLLANLSRVGHLPGTRLTPKEVRELRNPLRASSGATGANATAQRRKWYRRFRSSSLSSRPFPRPVKDVDDERLTPRGPESTDMNLPTVTKDPLRVALIGCGGITDAHLPVFASHTDRLALVAACDPSEPARLRVRDNVKGFATPDLFESPEEMLGAVADEVDAVLIVTPHFLHYPQVKLCVEHGLPCLVEKPLCNRLAEGVELKRAAQAANVTVMVGQTRRFDPSIRAAKRWLTQEPDAFGDLRMFEMSGWQNIEGWIAGKPDKGAGAWILDKDKAGGGVVVSLLVHYLDLIRYLSETDYDEVTARGRFEPPFRNGAESAASALLTTTDGAIGTMHANYLARKLP